MGKLSQGLVLMTCSTLTPLFLCGCNYFHFDYFNQCMSSILEHEGGLSKDKRDPGGITQWGISLRYLKSIGYDVNGDGEITEEDIIALPKDGAIKIYRKFWWDKYYYTNFNELKVVEKVFDLAVNMGGYGAHKLLQIAINNLQDSPIKMDGKLGVQTFAAANKLNADKLRQELRVCAEKRYNEILEKNPEMEWARKGWMNRARW
jgi:lysozyme family protein